MPELAPISFARLNLEQVRERLLAAAAFGEDLSPDQLETLAEKLGTGLSIYIEATQNTSPRPHRPTAPGRACLDFRGHQH